MVGCPWQKRWNVFSIAARFPSSSFRSSGALSTGVSVGNGARSSGGLLPLLPASWGSPFAAMAAEALVLVKALESMNGCLASLRRPRRRGISSEGSYACISWFKATGASLIRERASSRCPENSTDSPRSRRGFGRGRLRAETLASTSEEGADSLFFCCSTCVLGDGGAGGIEDTNSTTDCWSSRGSDSCRLRRNCGLGKKDPPALAAEAASSFEENWPALAAASSFGWSTDIKDASEVSIASIESSFEGLPLRLGEHGSPSTPSTEPGVGRVMARRLLAKLLASAENSLSSWGSFCGTPCRGGSIRTALRGTRVGSCNLGTSGTCTSFDARRISCADGDMLLVLSFAGGDRACR
mmetsp:Transcript_70754/g.202724  ORF Transcript_70754/g.202724 Transcript_70754/m.202724 type:complete len:354 (-) Transcript_70754:141-1202(-)